MECAVKGIIHQGVNTKIQEGDLKINVLDGDFKSLPVMLEILKKKTFTSRSLFSKTTTTVEIAMRNY
jgi:hypothetical protein